MTIPKINSLQPKADALLLYCDEPLSLEQLEREADVADRSSVEGITSAERRRERLMWRRMLREYCGQSIDVEYAADGAPRIKDFPYKNISVSHCRGVVAVVASDGVCGVDVERKDRRFESVASRYISEREWSLLQRCRCERSLFLAVVWCAKECLYKMAGRVGLDLREELSVEDVDLRRGIVRARVAGCESVEMLLIEKEEYLILYCC